MGFEKQWVKGLTSMVQNYFDLGMYTSSMSCLNADLIAISLALASPKEPKSPYSIEPPRASSVRNLLQKVGDLETL